MALTNCPECGKEISDKAKACPICGCPIEEIMSNLDIEKASDKKCDEDELSESTFTEDIENSEKTKKRHNRKIKIIILCVLVVILVAIGIVANYSKTNADSINYSRMSEQEKINVITQFLGEKININESISMSQELLDFMNHAELFEYYGVCTTGYSSNDKQDEVILDMADWISEDDYSDEMCEDVVEHLKGIYGETKIEENVSTDFQGEYVWRNVNGFSFIICGKNIDNKVDIRWMIEKTSEERDNNMQTSSEEFEMYTEYEGKYDKNAEPYEAYATECFLDELKSSEQDYAKGMGEPDAVINSEWNMSGTFESNGNYYFCYNYSFVAGGSKSHVLVKYDVKTQEASDETPLEWLDADIEALKEEMNL